MAKEKKQLTQKSVEEGDIKNVIINSNKDGSADVTGVVNSISVFESILDPTVRVTFSFVDTGHGEKKLPITDYLPIVGTENVNIKLEDGLAQKLDLTLYVNEVLPKLDDTQKNVTTLKLVSKEFFANENGKTRVVSRFDGKISDHINKILTDPTYINTDKNLDIETTKNRVNCWGRYKKPFAFTTWIQAKGVPNNAQGSAGFFLWETTEDKGTYKFKSVDALMEQKAKKKYIFSNIADEGGKNISPGYDGQLLEYDSDSNINVKRKLEIGTYKTRTILFNPFNCKYEIIKPTVGEGKKKMDPKLAAKELPVFNSEIDTDYTRTFYMLVDTGTLPTGDTQQQIEKSREQNDKPQDTLSQSKMRYNQMFTVKKSITVSGDFSLHAGDAIFIDIPEISDKPTQEINKQIGGLYIIVDLCHFVTSSPPGCRTRLNIVRDSYGRKQ